jgi:DNA-binding MarR family transcriptional regulator
MTLFERAIQRGIEEKLISSADWQRSLRLAREAGTMAREAASDRTASSRLFGRPAWSMLVYLFVMHANGRTANVRHCCRIAGLAPPSCLGCIEVLVEEGIITTRDNSADAEAPNVTLSPDGVRMVAEAIRELTAGGSHERAVQAYMPANDHRINERIAREMNISLKAVEMHRANMAAKSE